MLVHKCAIKFLFGVYSFLFLMKFHNTRFILILIQLSALLVFSDESDVDYILSDFVVTENESISYDSANSSLMTKTNELIKNTPINLSAVNQMLIDDLGIKTTEDLAQISSSIDTDPTGYSLDQIRIRGFRNVFTYYNGFRRNLPRDSYNIFRIDIIKGSNSLIFGQASPGGSVNAMPLIANFRDDAGSITLGFGNKDYKRTVLNYNKIINDKLAVRYMLADHSQGYEHAFKKYDLLTNTISVNYRPNKKESILLHLEKVNSTFNFPIVSMRDKTFIDDSDQLGGNMTEEANPRNAYDGYLSVQDTANNLTDYYVPFSPDWVQYADDALIQALIANTQGNIGPENDRSGNGIEINSRQDLIDYYGIINESNYGYQGGPDKYKDNDGVFMTGEYQKSLSENLQFNLALQHQGNKSENITRDYEGSNKVIRGFFKHHYNPNHPEFPKTYVNVYPNAEDGNGDIGSPEPYIRTYWIRSQADGSRYAGKATLLWEKEINNIENKFIFGYDYETSDTEQMNFDQVPETALNSDGSYLGKYTNSEIQDIDHRLLWVTKNQITDRERAFEYIPLAALNDLNSPILKYDDLIQNGFGGDVLTGYYRDDGQKLGVKNPNTEIFNQDGIRVDHDTGEIVRGVWALATDQYAKVRANSNWFAAQSNLLNGKLRTLIGFRYDAINVKSTLRKVSLYGKKGFNKWEEDSENVADLRFDNFQNVDYKKVSPSIGALYWVNKSFAIFGNYAESIEAPRGQERTPIGTLPPPEYGKGIEGGLRFNTLTDNLEGQITYYSIEKENDNEFTYSDSLLSQIYPKYQADGTTLSYYGENFPEIYWDGGSGIRSAGLPGRRGIGDVTLSEGIELDLNFKPTRSLSFLASVNKSIKNDIKKLHPLVQNPSDYELFGRPDYRASLTGRYAFKTGKLKGLACGLSQHFRSGSIATKFKVFYNEDENGNTIIVNEDNADYSQDVYLKFGDEHNTTAFISYKGKLGKTKTSPKYSINFRVNNLFDQRGFVNRGSYGFYRESRSYQLSTKINF
jgi:outer membrane receptor protein involved in Fe transport